LSRAGLAGICGQPLGKGTCPLDYAGPARKAPWC